MTSAAILMLMITETLERLDLRSFSAYCKQGKAHSSFRLMWNWWSFLKYSRALNSYSFISFFSCWGLSSLSTKLLRLSKAEEQSTVMLSSPFSHFRFEALHPLRTPYYKMRKIWRTTNFNAFGTTAYER